MPDRRRPRNSTAGSGWRAFLRQAVLLEAGAAILLFGSLIHHPELTGSGATALAELKAHGYVTPTNAEPVRVYPARTDGDFHSGLAGGWHPGVISLRESPTGGFGPEIYLRHELMHEASYRTCGGRLPLWAEEASAMHFSGELLGRQEPEPSDEDAIDHLRARVRIGASLDAVSYTALAGLVAVYGWPDRACAVSEQIQKVVTARTDSEFSFIMIHLLSGRVLESRGDLNTAYPPGSLLKIPYAASLTEGSDQAIGEELARSDTAGLLLRQNVVDFDRFRFLTSMVKESSLARDGVSGEGVKQGGQVERTYLGERDQTGNFPFEANLSELALVLRASFLSAPASFSGLAANGSLPQSTLHEASDANKAILKKLRALCKTGTVSDARGNPIVGHLLVAWPREDPQFLAVFRQPGMSGALTLRSAAGVVKKWSARYTAGFGQVNVRLLSLTPRPSWEVVEVCGSQERQEQDGSRLRFSTCGWFKILSSARGSRTERFVRGILQTLPEGDKVVLKTDPETYADAVLAAEAQDLRGEAAKALRAVIFWDGVHGSHRHPDSSSLCDTTHCMVFQGSTSREKERRQASTDTTILRLLDRLAPKKGPNWFSFSEGGVEQWQRQIPVAELQQAVNESTILDLRRERLRNGETAVHLIYPESEEQVPCELFRAKLKLPSCPETIVYDAGDGAWRFQGIGKGHGVGLSVEKVRRLGKSGYSAEAIIKDAYSAVAASK